MCMEISQEFDTLKIVSEMVRNLSRIRDYVESGRTNIKLRVTADWVTPIHILPLGVYANINRVRIDCEDNARKICDYFDRIGFPHGVKTVDESDPTALPLSKLRAGTDDKILGRYEEKIIASVSRSSRSSFSNALKYLTSELTTNVREHSGVDHYWILAQYWPSTETCEIAIADTGKGYLESYRGTKYETNNHHEAIQNVVEGYSSKGWVERGTGIPGTIRLFTEGYGGEIVVYTGNALWRMKDGATSRYDASVSWRGVVFGLRFQITNVNIYPYISGD